MVVLVPLQVGDGQSQPFDRLLGVADQQVAVVAEQRPYLAGRMAVIDMHASCGVRQLATQAAKMFLRREHPVVLVQRDAVQAAQALIEYPVLAVGRAITSSLLRSQALLTVHSSPTLVAVEVIGDLLLATRSTGAWLLDSGRHARSR